MPVLLIVIVVGAVIYFSRHGKGHGMVEAWARENGLELVSARRRWVRLGPFVMKTSKAQEVYRVEVAMGGIQKSGFVRVGGTFRGLSKKEVDVVWDG